MATVRAILVRTYASRSSELLLIQSRDDIMNPFGLPEPHCEVYVPASRRPQMCSDPIDANKG